MTNYSTNELMVVSIVISKLYNTNIIEKQIQFFLLT
jgi:hypothetical protein